MDFLGIGPLELLFIFLIILLVMGPEDMQRTARTLGRWLRRVMTSPYWRSFTHTTQELRQLPTRLAREAGLEEDLREVQEGIEAATMTLENSLIDPKLQQELRELAELHRPWGQTTTPVPYRPPTTPLAPDKGNPSPSPVEGTSPQGSPPPSATPAEETTAEGTPHTATPSPPPQTPESDAPISEA